MVLPLEMFRAAQSGDRDAVLAYLYPHGRARPRRTRGADPIVARAFKLPNEMVWKVLAFWRVESEVTGEVI